MGLFDIFKRDEPAKRARPVRRVTRQTQGRGAQRFSELSGKTAQGWEGARPHNDMLGFGRHGVPINQEIESDLTALRARSRHLAKNDGYVRRFLALAVTNIVGPRGFTFKSTVKTNGGKPQRNIAKAIEEGWGDFSKPMHFCARGELSLRDYCKLYVTQIMRDGELFTVRFDGEGEYGHRYQYVDPELCPVEYQGIAANGNRIRMGIEFDERGRKVAYYFRALHAIDANTYTTHSRQYLRIPADRVDHDFLIEYPDQLRGVPIIAAALLRARRIAGYEDAEVIAKRISSSKMAVVEPGDNNEAYEGDRETYESDTGEEIIDETDDGEDFIEIEPGTVARLARNAKLSTFDPQHHQDFDIFIKRMLRGLASALGISYHALASDLEGVNYSSTRTGVQDDRDIWMALQDFLIDHALTPKFETWLRRSLLLGRIVVAGKPLP
ncbi:MAG: phage portal protein, partial [Pseudomonadota bacterium]